MEPYFWIAIPLILGVIGWIVYRRVISSVETLSMTMFGTKSLIEGWNQQEDLLAATPKSVSAMTKLCLPDIEKDFPQFNWAEFRQKSENMLKASLTAVDMQDLGVMETPSEDLRQQVLLQIEDCKRRKVREHFEQIKIHQTEISRYQKRSGLCVITLQSAIEYLHFVEDETGNRISGSVEYLEQTKYDMELVYVQDVNQVQGNLEALGLTCPQCGAPITNLGSKYCEYCGSGIVEINIHVWSLNRIYQS